MLFFVQCCFARWPLKLSSTILCYVDLTLVDADWGMLSRFFWLCSRPLISFGLRLATSYTLLHVGTERLKRISNATRTMGKNWKKLAQTHADFCQKFESQLHICRFDHAEELTTLKMCPKDHNNDSCGRLFDIQFTSFFLFLLWPIRVAGWRVVGQALDSKSSITELCLADNDLGVKGAMFVIRKVGSDVQGYKSGVVRQTWHLSNSSSRFLLSLTQTAKRPSSCAGYDKEGRWRCFSFQFLSRSWTGTRLFQCLTWRRMASPRREQTC